MGILMEDRLNFHLQNHTTMEIFLNFSNALSTAHVSFEKQFQFIKMSSLLRR